MSEEYTYSDTDPYNDLPDGPEAPTGNMALEAAIKRIAAAYKQYLKRDGTREEHLSHLGGGTAYAEANILWAIQSIRNSPAAQAILNAPTTPTTPAGTTPPAPPRVGNGPRPTAAPRGPQQDVWWTYPNTGGTKVVRSVVNPGGFSDFLRTRE